MPIVGGSGLGAAGTRINKTQDTESELWIYVKQASLGALAFDVGLLLFLVVLLCIGWPSLVLAFGALAFVTRFALGYVVNDILARKRLTRALFISYGLAFVIFSPYWWRLLVGRDVLLPLLGMLVKPFILPIWVYGLMLVAWFIGALNGRGWVAVLFLFLAICLYGGYMLPSLNWYPLLIRLRYITPAFLLAPILFSVVLAAAMLKEMVLPNFDITLVPMKFSEWVDARGLFGVLSPRVRRIVPQPRLRIQRVSNGGKKLEEYDIPHSSRAMEFYQAVLNGETFNNKTAKMNRVKFNQEFRDPFVEKELAEYNVPGAPTQGVSLTDEGIHELERVTAGDVTPEWDD